MIDHPFRIHHPVFSSFNEAEDEKAADDYERQGEDHYKTKAHAHGLIHVVVVLINNGRQGKANKGEQDATEQFPFPGND